MKKILIQVKKFAKNFIIIRLMSMIKKNFEKLDLEDQNFRN